jgi:hypothetical protein
MNTTIAAERVARLLGITRIAVVQKILDGELRGLIKPIGYSVFIDNKLRDALESAGSSMTIHDLMIEVNDSTFSKYVAQLNNINSTPESSNNDIAGKAEMDKPKSETSFKSVHCDTSRALEQQRLFEDPHSKSEQSQLIDRLIRQNSLTSLDLLFLINPKR